MREIPFGNDGDFSHAAMVRRINHDLANDFGNLAQRVLSMVQRNCSGVLPGPGSLSVEDEALLGAARNLLGRLRAEMELQATHRALELIWEVVGQANRYVDAQAPWTLRKTDPPRMGTVLWTLAEVIRHLALLVQPFMPTSGASLLDQLAVPAEARTFASVGQSGALRPETRLPPPAGVFPRFVEA